MKSFVKNAVILFFVFIFSLTAVVEAQQTSAARISGTIKDPNGALLPAAQVVLNNRAAQSDRTISTDVNGNFAFENVAPGNYVVRVSARGFSDSTVPMQIKAGETKTLDITVSVAQAEAVVTAEVGSSVERQSVPQAVTLIGEQKILERAEAVLAQAAQEEAGVNLQRTSPTIGSVFVRGLVGGKVNVYVDGVRFTTGAQRGGINTFLNLNEPSGLQSIEILRGSSSGVYGSDALGGTVSLISKNPILGDKNPEFHGEINTNFSSADLGFGGSTLFSYGTERLGGYVNLAARRINTLRAARGLDTHSSLTRFLGLPSSITGSDRLPDTAFSQYGGSARLNFSPRSDQQIVFNYQRSQQDGGKRYDQLLGGDGNNIADLRNLMLDFGYLRYIKQNFFGFDSASFTASYNSQREERVNQGGQGDPFGGVTHQYERTTATGFSFFLDKNLPRRNSFLVGGDIYRERVNAPAYTFNPRTGAAPPSRPRVPDESRYTLGGLYVQNAWQAVPERLRVSGALRYNVARYKVRGDDSPIVNGQRLWRDDSLRVADFSGRVGAVVRIVDELRVAASYARGFRAPNITDLGTLGLTGDGFEVDYTAANNLGGTIGTTAAASAVSTGIPVAPQRSEITNNYDLGLRYGNRRFETEATVFLIDFRDSITKQALILPAGAVGKFLGDQPIVSQNANGAVFVPLSTSPVFVRTNYSAARIYGFEYELEARVTDELKFTGNYTFIRAEDKASGLPPNIEGGTPPPTAFLSLRYDPTKKPFWIELYSTLAARQDRLSSLDLSDRRTGATRSRSQIANFIRRGACVRGFTVNASGTGCGNAGNYVLSATGETLAQVQNRVLPIGSIVNGVAVVNDSTGVPLYTELPGYGIVNLRGGIRLGENSQIFLAFENIFDQPYRNPSWGVDGTGRNFRAAYKIRF